MRRSSLLPCPLSCAHEQSAIHEQQIIDRSSRIQTHSLRRLPFPGFPGTLQHAHAPLHAHEALSTIRAARFPIRLFTDHIRVFLLLRCVLLSLSAAYASACDCTSARYLSPSLATSSGAPRTHCLPRLGHWQTSLPTPSVLSSAITTLHRFPRTSLLSLRRAKQHCRPTLLTLSAGARGASLRRTLAAFSSNIPTAYIRTPCPR